MYSRWESLCSMGEYMLGNEKLKKMKKWKDGLTGGELLIIWEKQLMKIGAGKLFELLFVTSTRVALIHKPSGHNYRQMWQAMITCFPKKLTVVLSSINDWQFTSPLNSLWGDVGPWFIPGRREQINGGLLYGIRQRAHFPQAQTWIGQTWARKFFLITI